jgi:hypothetical protein
MVIKANGQIISIRLPKEYVGKQVEIIAFTIEETISCETKPDQILTQFASEKVLARDWLTAQEDAAWQDL